MVQASLGPGQDDAHTGIARVRREVVIAAMNSRLDALSHASEELQNDFELLSWLKTMKNVPDNKKQWFEERMKVLEILEDEAWMKKNNLVAKQSVKPKKF